jgi:putative nucleotidyltransferase with HDIG domain
LVAQLERTIEGAVSIAAHMVEKRDPYTAGHQEAVARIATDIAVRLELPAEQIALVRTAAALHDIGKIAIPAEILVKPGKLDQFEWLLIQRHPEVCAEILEDAELGGPIAQIIRQHHERPDGSGYPAGLLDGEICLEAKIIAVADTTEAMLAHRPYRPALSLEETTAELKSGRGTRYDADVVDACLAVITPRASAPADAMSPPANHS